MAVHRPVIFMGPESCEIGRVIKEHGSGVILPSQDSDGLAQAILKFRSDPEHWFAAQKGTQAVNEKYNPEQSFKAWRKVLSDVMAGASRKT